ncbi:acyltransferase family protein [Planctomycetaceae bacterium SH139]
MSDCISDDGTTDRATRNVPLPVRRSTRYQTLDIWRGVACLAVLVHHSVFYNPEEPEGLASSVVSQWTHGLTSVARWGWIGVPVFFVISGYCIGATVESSKVKSTRAVEFFAKRFRRIFPPYWLAFGITAFFVVLVDYVLMPHAVSSVPGGLTLVILLGTSP